VSDHIWRARSTSVADAHFSIDEVVRLSEDFRARASSGPRAREVDASDVDAIGGKARDESRGFGGDPEVCDQREVESGADGWAVDKGDGWDGEPAYALEAAVQTAKLFVCLVCACIVEPGQDVPRGSRTECGVSSGDHGDADGRIGVRMVTTLDQLGNAGLVERVARGLTVEFDPGDASTDRQGDVRPRCGSRHVCRSF